MVGRKDGNIGHNGRMEISATMEWPQSASVVKRFPLRVRVNCAVSNPVSVRLYIYD